MLWREHLAPLIALEFASGNGREERDATPLEITDKAERKAAQLVARLRAIGIDPEADDFDAGDS